MRRRTFGEIQLRLDAAQTILPVGDVEARVPLVVQVLTNEVPADVQLALVHRVRSASAEPTTTVLRKQSRSDDGVVFVTTLSGMPRDRRVDYDFVVRRSGEVVPESGDNERPEFHYSFTVRDLATKPDAAGPPQFKSPASNLVDGMVLAAPDRDIAGIEVELHSSFESSQALTVARTDERGRFSVPCDIPALGIWFRYGRDQLHRTPRLQPWRSGPVRLARYAEVSLGKPQSTVAGTVESISGSPLTSLRVHLVEQTLTRCRAHASSWTDRAGRFELAYDAKHLLDAVPDLRVLVMGPDGSLLYESKTPQITLPNFLPPASEGRAKLLPASTSYAKHVRELLTSQINVPLDTLASTDIEYLADRHRVSASRLETLHATEEIAKRHGINREAAFALVVRGVKREETFKNAIDEAIHDGVVSSAALEGLDHLDLVERDVRRESLLSSTLATALERRLPDTDLRAKAVSILGAATNGAAAWDAIEKEASLRPYAAGIRFTAEATRLLRGDKAMVNILEARYERGATELSQYASLSGDDWFELLEQTDVPIPPHVPGASLSERRTAYANVVFRSFEREFPGVAFRAHLQRTPNLLSGLGALQRLLQSRPLLDLGRPVRESEADDPQLFAGVDGARARAAACGFERLRQLTPKVAVAATLLNSGLSSAHAITSRRSRSMFVEDLRNVAGGALEAHAIYDAALRQSQASRWLYSLYSDTFAKTKTRVTSLPSTALKSSSSTSAKLGLWRQVFGKDDLGICECSDCKSVFGPAAYLFDMLLFVRRFNGDKNGIYDKLLELRPEIPELPLTCDNTNIRVPYIDLVNELLEPLVDGSTTSLTPGKCEARSTTGTSEERRAEPEYAPSPGVVSAVRNAPRPWRLFDRDRALADGAMSRLAVDGDAILRAQLLRCGGDVAAIRSLIANIAARALTLGRPWDSSSGELKMLVTPATTNLEVGRYWGKEILAALQKPEGPSVAAILRASKLSFDEFWEVLQQRFVREVLGTRTLVAIELAPKGCDLETMFFDRSVAQRGAFPFISILDRVHRFSRLLRKVKWPAQVLDDFLHYSAERDFADGVLTIGVAKDLQRRCGWSDDETQLMLCPLYDDVARRDSSGHVETKVFERLFRPTAQPTLAGTAKEQRTQLLDWIARTAGVTDAELSRLINAKLVADPTGLPARGTIIGAARFHALVSGFGASLSEIVSAGTLAEHPCYSPLGASDTRTPGERTGDVLRTLLAVTSTNREMSAQTALELFDTTSDEDLLPTPKASGDLLESVHAAVQACRDEAPVSGGSFVRARAALATLLGDAADTVDPTTSEPRIQAAMRMVELSAILAELDPTAPHMLDQGGALSPLLPFGAVLPSELPVSAAETQAAASAAVALDATVKTAVVAVLRNSVGPNVAGAQYASLVNDCANAARARYLDPASAAADLFTPVVALLTALSAVADPAEVAVAVTRTVTEEADGITSTARALAISRWLAPLELAAARRRAEVAVIGALASAFAVDSQLVDVLLRYALTVPGTTRSLLETFVPRDLQTHHATVAASYRSVRFTQAGTPVQVGVACERRESALHLNWQETLPPAGIDAESFHVVLTAAVQRSSLVDANGAPLDIVLDTEGDAVVRLSLADGSSQSTLTAGPQPDPRWHAFTPASIPGSAGDSIVVEIEVTTRLSSVSAELSLRTFTSNASGKLRALRPGRASPSLLLLTKSIRLCSALAFAPLAWLSLSQRGFSPNELPTLDSPSQVTRRQWVDRLEKLTALRHISSLSPSASSPRFIVSLLDGEPIPNEVARGALVLTSPELQSELLQDLSAASVPAEHVVMERDPRRLLAGLQLVILSRTTGLSPTTLAVLDRKAAAAVYSEAAGVLRARLPRDRWLVALTQVHDPVREAWRDALVAHLTNNGIRPSPQVAIRVDTIEDLKDRLLVETLMSSCQPSSRIDFAHMAIQRFVRRVLEGLTTVALPSAAYDELAAEWSWRQLYRLWEANRRVFAHTESYLEPDLRPDKTHLFRELEEQLLSDDVTHELAQDALGQYLAGLNRIARPEMLGFVEVAANAQSYIPRGFRNEDQSGLHLFARSRTQPQELFHRRRTTDGRWLPWERIDVTLKGTHFVPLFAFGKVMLFSFEVELQKEKVRHNGNDCPEEGPIDVDPDEMSTAGTTWKLGTTYSWVEHVNGRWRGPFRGERATVDVDDWIAEVQDAMEWDDNWRVDADTDFPEEKYPAEDELVKQLNFEIEVGTRGWDAGKVPPIPPADDDAYESLDSRFRAKVPNVTPNPVDLKNAGEAWIGSKFSPNPVTFAPVKANSISQVHLWMEKAIDGALHDEFTLKKLTIWHPRNNGTRVERYNHVYSNTVLVTQYDGHPVDPQDYLSTANVNHPLIVALNYVSSTSLEVARNNSKYFECDDAESTIAMELDVSSCAIKVETTTRAITFSLEVAACAELRRARRFRYIRDPAAGDFVPSWSTGWQDGTVQVRKQSFRRCHIADLVQHADGSTRLTEFIPPETRSKAGYGLTFQKLQIDDPNFSWFPLPLGSLSTTVPVVAIQSPHPFSVSSIPNSFRYELRSSPKIYDENQAPAGESLRSFLVTWQSKLTLESPYRLSQPLDARRLDTNDLPALVSGERSVRLERLRERLLGPPGDATFRPSIALDIDTTGTANMEGRAAPTNLDPELQLDEILSRLELALTRSSSSSAAWAYAASAALSLDTPHSGLEKYWGWRFEELYHPQAAGFLRLYHAYKAPALISLEAQRLVSSAISGDELAWERWQVDSFEKIYQPSPLVHPNYPHDIVDFSSGGAYAEYNWELFYHIPLFIAERLDRSRKFDDADAWFRLLFDPTDARRSGGAQKGFSTLPLFNLDDLRLEELLELIEDPDIHSRLAAQIDRLNRYPYQPHLIARLRLGAYQRALVMRYLDHLFAWADDLFAKAYALDQPSFLFEAAEKYDVISRILGPRPESIPNTQQQSTRCFNAIVTGQDDVAYWDPLVELEATLGPITGSGNVPSGGVGIPQLYFCIPHNQQLLEYWSNLEDRQTKLGRCLDLEGNHRELTLYGTPIDPGLLVQATAMGLDIDTVLDLLAAPLSRFRFQVLWQRAREVCADAKALAQSLLAVTEKKEGEELTALRSEHEIAMLKAARGVKEKQLAEATASLSALTRSRGAAELRRQYYASRERQNSNEKTEGKHLERASGWEDQATADSTAAASWALVPDLTISAGVQYAVPPWVASAIVSYSIGGTLASKVLGMNSTGSQRRATLARTDAARAGREANFERRAEDWKLQEQLAAKDIAQIDLQITAATHRQTAATLELENHDRQIDQSEVVHEFMRDKFTSAQLYRWMEKRLNGLYRQQYRLAVDLAMQAERALEYELGLERTLGASDPFDPIRLGHTAGDQLMAKLDAVQARYLKESRREDEKIKDFSLAEHDPFAFLELVATGNCIFEMREDDFDADVLGAYFRRLKHVSITIPCVKRPYASVNARLTLLRSSIRTKPSRGTDGHLRDDLATSEHILTSTGVRDSGLFEVSLNGDKRLPFEGAGAISVWRLELDPESNDFERTTMTDVVLHVMYTARDGGELEREAALKSRRARLTAEGTWVLLHSSTLGNAWDRFTAGNSKQARTLEVKLTANHLPHSMRNTKTLKELRVLLDPADSDANLSRDPIVGLHEWIRSAPANGLALPLDQTPSVDCSPPNGGWVLIRA